MNFPNDDAFALQLGPCIDADVLNLLLPPPPPPPPPPPLRMPLHPPGLAFYHASYNAPRAVRPHFKCLLIDFGRRKGPQDACDAEMEAVLGPPSDSFGQAGELTTWKPSELQLNVDDGVGGSEPGPVLGLKVVYHPVHEGMPSERGPPVYLSEDIGGEANLWGRVHAMTGQMLWTQSRRKYDFVATVTVILFIDA